jgi:hypothetical protein
MASNLTQHSGLYRFFGIRVVDATWRQDFADSSPVDAMKKATFSNGLRSHTALEIRLYPYDNLVCRPALGVFANTITFFK